MSLLSIAKNAEKLVRVHSPAILTAFGVSGALTTAYLAGKASYEAAGKLQKLDDYEYLTTKEKVEMVWELYIPAAISGVITVGCIIGANHVSSKRTAAAYSLLAVSENAFTEYREKIVEQIGAKKEETIRDDIAQDRINKNPPGSNIIIAGTGEVLCCEMFTGRYFQSDMETLRKAENDINSTLIREMWVPLSELYYILKLPYTSHCGEVGWEAGSPLELKFSTVMSEDNRPCIAFDYNYIKPLKGL